MLAHSLNSLRYPILRDAIKSRDFCRQGGDREDDYTVIQVLKDLSEPVVINTYEADFANEFLVQTHHHVNGLDGKVSRVEVFVL